MNDQLARGLPPIDDEYQGPSWWHFSRLGDARRNPGMRRIAALGVLVVLGGRHGHRDPQRDLGLERHARCASARFEVPVTIYPPFVLSLLAAIWLGPTWGLVPAYAANLAGALVSGPQPRGRRSSSRSPGALEVLIFWGSMVTLNISPELRRCRDFARFFLVCLIAPITASLAVLIWNTAHGLDTGGRACASGAAG